MLEERKRVNVYRNLRKDGIQYSVAQDGTVRQYEYEVMLKDVRFKHANPKQLEEVRSGPRQVCQWVSGLYIPRKARDEVRDQCFWTRINSDPTKVNGFVSSVTGRQIKSAKFVELTATGLFAAGIEE